MIGKEDQLIGNTDQRRASDRFESSTPRFFTTLVAFWLIGNGVQAFLPFINEGNAQREIPNSGPQPSVGPEKSGVPAIDFGPYLANLERRIKRSWFPPRGNESKRVVAIFKVHKDGRVTDVRLSRSSGVAIADQAAIRAIQNAAPMPRLPEGAAENVDIQFTFDYNVFNGHGGKTPYLGPSPDGADHFYGGPPAKQR